MEEKGDSGGVLGSQKTLSIMEQHGHQVKMEEGGWGDNEGSGLGRQKRHCGNAAGVRG